MRYALALAGLFIVCAFQGMSQQFGDFQRVASLPVTKEGKTLQNAFAGGLNSIQPSSLDVDLDGFQDLVVFDREGDAFKVFLYREKGSGFEYVFDPAKAALFPDSAFSLAIFRDFDNDGRKDLFTHPAPDNAYLVLYRQTDSAAFVRVEGPLIFQRTTTSFIPLYSMPEEIPLIEDLDNDGDLDLVIPTESPTPSLFSLIRNYSQEEHGVPDKTDAWRLESKCYGKIQEYGYLYQRPISCPPLNMGNRGQRMDGGSTLLGIELNGDGKKDILISNTHVNDRLVALFNDSTGLESYINDSTIDYRFPHYDVPVAIGRLTMCHSVDANNDGKEDLLCGTNSLLTASLQGSDSASRHGIDWYYENTSSGGSPHFELQQKDFLTSTMIDVGARAHAAFSDVDGDGLQDMLIGREGSSVFGGEEYAGLTLYKNVGSETYPQFEWVTDSYTWWQQSEYPFEYFQFGAIAPAFGDLDNDGDDDLIIGRDDGKLIYLSNVPVGGVARFVLTQVNYKQIDVGSFAKPVLFDLNSDGLLDMVIGNQQGKISYFENKGSKSQANFNSNATIASLGQIDMAPLGGMASLDFTRAIGQQKLYAVAAGNKGKVFLYGPISNISQPFPLADSMGFEGSINAVKFQDLLGDGRPEMIISEMAGGTAIYTMEEDLNLLVREPVRTEVAIRCFPNPAQDKLYIEIPNLRGQAEVAIYSLQGQPLQKAHIAESRKELDIANLPQGAYIVLVKDARRQHSLCLIKQ